MIARTFFIRQLPRKNMFASFLIHHPDDYLARQPQFDWIIKINLVNEKKKNKDRRREHFCLNKWVLFVFSVLARWRPPVLPILNFGGGEFVINDRYPAMDEVKRIQTISNSFNYHVVWTQRTRCNLIDFQKSNECQMLHQHHNISLNDHEQQ